ncbi:MAG: HRDC domain-containing protein, partial [Vicinamibacteria bacterium]
RKALSAVARIHRQYGLQAAVKLLKGEADPRLERSGLDRTPTFGALRERSEAWLLQLLRRCVTAGWVDFDGGDRPVAMLTEAGRAVMKAERPARLLLPPEGVATPRGGGRARGSSRGASSGGGLAPGSAESQLFEALRAHRLALSRSDGVPPYVVASDRTLREIAVLAPRTRADLMQVHGIGPAKADRYGAGLLQVVERTRTSA